MHREQTWPLTNENKSVAKILSVSRADVFYQLDLLVII